MATTDIHRLPQMPPPLPRRRRGQASDDTPPELGLHGELHQHLAGGILAGQVAGAAMAVVLMVAFAIGLKHSAVFPLQVMGATVFGPEALATVNAKSAIVGLLIHQLGLCLAWGAIFGAATWFLGFERGPGVFILGVLTGCLAQLVDSDAVVPAVMRALHGQNFWRENVPGYLSWGAHIMFGLSLGAAFNAVYARIVPESAHRPSATIETLEQHGRGAQPEDPRVPVGPQH